MVKRKNTAGQALMEYVLMMLVVGGAGFLLMGPMKNILAMLEKPLREDFRLVYKYGDPKACGQEDNFGPCSGSPTRHPRIYAPDNFRMFGRGK